MQRLITSIIFSVTYGKKINNMDDEYVTYAQRGVEGISQATIPGIYWVEYIPLLKYIPSWVPGTTSRKLADKYLPYVLGMRDKPYNEVKAAMVRQDPAVGSCTERSSAGHRTTGQRHHL